MDGNDAVRTAHRPTRPASSSTIREWVVCSDHRTVADQYTLSQMSTATAAKSAIPVASISLAPARLRL
jgi:hypothetical protein